MTKRQVADAVTALGMASLTIPFSGFGDEASFRLDEISDLDAALPADNPLAVLADKLVMGTGVNWLVEEARSCLSPTHHR